MTPSPTAGSPPPPSLPAWAQAVDLLCLCLAILAGIAAMSHGFRIRIAGVRFGLTSPYRLLFWAGALGLVRYFAARTVPAPTRHAPDGQLSIGFLVRILLLFTALTAAMTYPQIWRMGDAVHDAGDPLLNLWALSWVAHQLPIAPAHLFDANIFFPEQWTLAYSETLLAPAVVVAPLLWMGVSRILVYNLVFVAGFIFSGVGTALLVRDLTRHTGASIVAGIIFAFLPFRFDHYAQLQLQQAEWIPLALWAFHRVMRSGRLRDGLWLGLCVSGQMLSCMYYGIFLAGYLVVVGGALMLSNLSVSRTRLLALAVGVALAIALLAPAGQAYLGAREVVGERGPGENIGFSATWPNYFAAPASNKLYGWSADRFGSLERRLFPGLVAVALAVVALWPPWSPIPAAYALGLAFAVDLTLGFNGLTYRFLYDHAAPFRALRIPALAVILVGFSLAVLAGFGVARLSARLKAPSARAALVPLLCVAALLESLSTPVDLITIPSAPPAIYSDMLRDIRESSPVPIVEVPVGRNDPTYMYYSTFHWQRLLNGYSGFFPTSNNWLVRVMEGFPDVPSMAELAARGTRYVVIHGEQLEPDEYLRIIRATDGRQSELTLVARRPWQDREISLYRLR